MNDKFILKQGIVFYHQELVKKDVYIEKGCIKEINDTITKEDVEEIDVSNCLVCLGFIDMHVHLREPGYEYKETIETGTLSGLYGGFSHIVAMANTNPCMDTVEVIEDFQARVMKGAHTNVSTFSAITKELAGKELVAMGEIIKRPIVIGFSDDGKGVQNDQMMESAMKKAYQLNSIIVAHCEDERELLRGACVNEGVFSKQHDLIGINNASEYNQVARDIDLVRQIGNRYHVCHVSTKESVELIKQAKKEDLHVSGEVSPHHLLLSDDEIKKACSLYKMNPPLRSKEDKLALLKGLNEGVLEVIATDHAPHSREEKKQSIDKAPFGIIGLQHAFPLLYTRLVKENLVSLETILNALTINPRKLLQIEGSFDVNQPADICVFDLEKEYQIKEEDIVSKSSNMPFLGVNVFGELKLMIINGDIKLRR